MRPDVEPLFDVECITTCIGRSAIYRHHKRHTDAVDLQVLFPADLFGQTGFHFHTIHRPFGQSHPIVATFGTTLARDSHFCSIGTHPNPRFFVFVFATLDAQTAQIELQQIRYRTFHYQQGACFAILVFDGRIHLRTVCQVGLKIHNLNLILRKHAGRHAGKHHRQHIFNNSIPHNSSNRFCPRPTHAHE